MLKRLLNLFNRPQPQEENKVANENESGIIKFAYEASTADFTVESDIEDLSRESAIVLTKLLFLLNNGSLTKVIYESLGIWAANDPDKKQFLELLIYEINSFNDEMSKLEEQSSNNTLAVRASEVFNMRGMRE